MSRLVVIPTLLTCYCADGVHRAGVLEDVDFSDVLHADAQSQLASAEMGPCLHACVAALWCMPSFNRSLSDSLEAG